MPNPRNERVDSVMMAWATARVALTITGPMMFGTTWRTMIRVRDAPDARAASMYSLLEPTRRALETWSSWTAIEKTSLENFATALALVPDLASGTRDEKALLARIIRAKAGRDEMQYLHLMQGHHRLRDALLTIGS